MGRVINTNSPGKRRSFHMRTIAEILRRLSQKSQIDDEVRDMVAMIVFSLREIDSTVLESIEAWEKRNYWKKADDFQQKWWWASQMANNIEKMVRTDAWEQLPDFMVKLLPQVADIQINKMMRNASTWEGAYDKLVEEPEKS
ncbi:hypothetical protein G4Y79_13550 [Phototrophicus methaneseepsis]|uniref:Uncharacterized protein n=1 Tax=Phototrophicus methaneseepsis TaxID=2710758 RepID=A0A7S8E5H8_9CHLR|nr:hypothetical protein [Phototrophicus methaneseepsis]QPC80737.1 hypothetical protein G4Y79_13550 [Phototrophicus methaneseepsis]